MTAATSATPMLELDPAAAAGRVLCAAQGEERDLRRHAEANGRADGAETAIDVERGRLARGCAGPSVLVPERRPYTQRPLVQARDIRREELRRAEAMIEDLDAHLAAMGMPGELQLDAELGGAREGIWIVREQDVRHIVAHHARDGVQHRPTAPNGALALIVHADQVEGLAVMDQF